MANVMVIAAVRAYYTPLHTVSMYGLTSSTAALPNVDRHPCGTTENTIAQSTHEYRVAYRGHSKHWEPGLLG